MGLPRSTYYGAPSVKTDDAEIVANITAICDEFEADGDIAGLALNSVIEDGCHSKKIRASVSKTCLVRFDNNKYSVAANAVGRPVDVQAYADRIVIRQDGRIVAEHRRSFGRGQTHLRSLALRASACTQARRLAQWSAVQGLGFTGGRDGMGARNLRQMPTMAIDRWSTSSPR